MTYLSRNHKVKVKKAYSLLELMISLAIIAVATVVMINFLIVSVQITVRGLARSFVREEISNSTVLMARDIRNADNIIFLPVCDPTKNNCEIRLSINGTKYRWYDCRDGSAYRICKDTWDSVTGKYVNTYKSSANVNIKYLDISTGYSKSTNNTEVNILITVAASHARTDLNINNVLSQTSASTRNYEF